MRRSLPTANQSSAALKTTASTCGRPSRHQGRVGTAPEDGGEIEMTSTSASRRITPSLLLQCSRRPSEIRKKLSKRSSCCPQTTLVPSRCIRRTGDQGRRICSRNTPPRPPSLVVCICTQSHARHTSHGTTARNYLVHSIWRRLIVGIIVVCACTTMYFEVVVKKRRGWLCSLVRSRRCAVSRVDAAM